MCNKLLVFIAYLSISCCLEAFDEFDKDLEYIYQTIIEDHPGLYYSLDPLFAERLEDNYKKFKGQLELEEGKGDKKAIVKQFGESFEDSHLWVKYEDQLNFNQNKSVAYEIEELTKGVVWIRIPSFYPSTEEQRRSFQQIVDALPNFRDKSVVFDLRGNHGGSYIYGTKLIEALFTKPYAEQRLFEWYQNSYVVWRVSKGNIQHQNEVILPYFRDHHQEMIRLVEWNERLSQSLEEAFNHNQPLYFQPLDFKGTFSLPLVENPVKGKVFAVVDPHCHSATLMFLDELKGMKSDVTLIGEVTGADTMYMELRVLPLPSGKGKFAFPIYVYMGPCRGHNIPHYPDIQYQGDAAEYILQLTDSSN